MHIGFVDTESNFAFILKLSKKLNSLFWVFIQSFSCILKLLSGVLIWIHLHIMHCLVRTVILELQNLWLLRHSLLLLLLLQSILLHQDHLVWIDHHLILLSHHVLQVWVLGLARRLLSTAITATWTLVL